MCAHADVREGFRVCAVELRKLVRRLHQRLTSLVTTPPRHPRPRRAG